MEQHSELMRRLSLQMGESSVLVPQQRWSYRKNKIESFWRCHWSLDISTAVPAAGHKALPCASLFPFPEQGRDLSCKDSYRWWFHITYLGRRFKCWTAKPCQASTMVLSNQHPQKWVETTAWSTLWPLLWVTWSQVHTPYRILQRPRLPYILPFLSP